MAFTLRLTSTAPPADVLRAIEGLGREWRESALPPTLRRDGGLLLRVKVRGARFRLSWGSYAEAASPVVVEGTVGPLAEGSEITAEVGHGRLRLLGAGLFAALGAVVWLSGGTGSLWLFSLALVTAGIDQWQHSRLTRDNSEEAANLVAGLERVIATAPAAA